MPVYLRRFYLNQLKDAKEKQAEADKAAANSGKNQVSGDQIIKERQKYLSMMGKQNTTNDTPPTKEQIIERYGKTSPKVNPGK